ncbi:WD40-repeat-containing domain protein [Lineolata rhizophorae]|uniref:WD40-repeat-containing domain protein n=1 Tax=Lineolata rhizophorae TaxID=578093 RepID=A0A6A6NVN5_9PEZI|nr:WD40-repeat-containing domain protein [Lineolata rhizophorae]
MPRLPPTLPLLNSTTLSLPNSTWLYRLVPLRSPSAGASAVAALASDDSIRLFDPEGLALLPDGVRSGAHEGVTCLVGDDESGGGGRAQGLLWSAGRDGVVRGWDWRGSAGRGLGEVGRCESPKKGALSALLYSPASNLVAAGMELEGNAPGDAPIFLWDTRKLSTPVRTYADSHNDTITELALHPTHRTTLLTASTDGLLNLLDTTIPDSDEDDALLQVVNHGSALHHAGFLPSSLAPSPASAGLPATAAFAADLYALGTDETLSFHRAQHPDEAAEPPAPRRLGDVREALACEYVIKLITAGRLGGGSGPGSVVVGSHSQQYVDVIPLRAPPAQAGSLDWGLGVEGKVRLEGAHGEEVVRDVLVDESSGVIFTCGEDGYVRTWGGYQAGPDDDGDVEMEMAGDREDGKKKQKKHDRKHKHKHKKEKPEVRYHPY